ncbi:MAG: hypothetical protein ABI675_11280 [Chitinophagaceae bacterium]
MKNIFNLILILLLASCNNESKNSPVVDGQMTGKADEKNVTDSGVLTKDPGTRRTNEKEVKAAGTDNPPEAFDANKNAVNPDAAADNPAVANLNTTDPEHKNTEPAVNPISPGDNPESLTDGGDKTVVYVGVFARWNFRAGEQYDGSYDTTHSLFVFCSSNHCKEVPRTQIIFQEFGNCDTSIKDRIKLFKIQKNGSINPNGQRIEVIGNKGYIKVGEATRAIEFDPSTIRRIRNAKIASGIKTVQPQPGIKRVNEVTVPEPRVQEHLIKSVQVEKEIPKPEKEIKKSESVDIEEKKIVPPAKIEKQVEILPAAKKEEKPSVSSPNKIYTPVKVDTAAKRQQTIIRNINREQNLKPKPKQ